MTLRCCLLELPLFFFFHLLLAGLVGRTSSVALLCPLVLFRVVLSDGTHILVCDVTCIPLACSRDLSRVFPFI